MLDIQSLSLAFRDRVILDEVNWQVPDGSRVALVGPNGVGKSTLLRLLAGEIEPDRGNITLSRKQVLGYLPQDLVDLEPIPLRQYLRWKSGLTGMEQVMTETQHQMSHLPPDSQDYRTAADTYAHTLASFEHLGGYDFDARAGRILAGLGFRDRDMEKLCSEFSGGWKMRIQLAYILMLNPDVMMLDEPTNHLDTESMEWLEDFLGNFRGTLIAVSHDRRFLEKMMTVTAELSRGRLTVYPGRYSYYLEQKELRARQLENAARKQDEYIERTTKFIERFRYKATKAAQVQSRIKQLDKIDRVQLETGQKVVRIRFPEAPKCAYDVLTVEKVVHGYDGNIVLNGIDVKLRQGEKVALVGVNGAGKSTLARLLSKQEKPNSGKVEWGKGVSLGFFAQESRMNLDYRNTVWGEINSLETELPEMEVRNLLGAFLFSGDDLEKRVEVLSGGEKSRLTLCKLLLEHHNLLILDEATNHLDMVTRDLFQEALKEYTGTLVLVSHDRHFLDQLITRVIEIRDHKPWVYMGNYSEFLQKRAALLSKLAEVQAARNPEFTEDSSKSPRELEKERKRREADNRKILSEYKKTIQKIESKIHTLETETKKIQTALCDPAVYADGEKVKNLNIQLHELEESLETLYDQWHENHEALESKEKELTEIN